MGNVDSPFLAGNGEVLTAEAGSAAAATRGAATDVEWDRYEVGLGADARYILIISFFMAIMVILLAKHL